MRILIILLLLVGVSFVVIESYALMRPGDSAAGADSTSCSSAPPMKDGEVDKDAAEAWCRDPPAVLGSLTRRFAPRTYFLDRAIRASVETGSATEPVAALPIDQRGDVRKSQRLAPFEWRAGGPMVLRHADQTLCLCQPGRPLDTDHMGQCGAGWIAHRRAANGALTCAPGDDAGLILLAPEGGSLRFDALDGASTVAQPSH